MSDYNDPSIIPKLKTYSDPNKKQLGPNPTVTKSPPSTKVPGAQINDATKNPNGYTPKKK